MAYKILVTGSTGILGSSLVPFLINQGYEISTHAKSTNADFIFDLSRKDLTFDLLRSIKPNIIINLAALTDVDYCERRFDIAYSANTLIPEIFSSWIKIEDPTCHLIHLSTDHVYDCPGLNTEENIKILNCYALSKYAGELALSGTNSTIIRTNFIGLSHSSRSSFTDWLYQSLHASEKISVFEDISFNPISINRLVELIGLMVTNKPGGIYNIGSRGSITKADFCLEFSKAFNIPSNKFIRVNSSDSVLINVMRPKNMCMNISKLENRLKIVMPKLIDTIQEVSKEYVN